MERNKMLRKSNNRPTDEIFFASKSRVVSEENLGGLSIRVSGFKILPQTLSNGRSFKRALTAGKSWPQLSRHGRKQFHFVNMNTSTYIAERSRSVAAKDQVVSSRQIFTGTSDEPPRPFNLSEFLYRKSNKLKRDYSNEEMSQLRDWNADAIEKLKSRIELVLFRSGKWRSKMTPIPPGEKFKLILERMWAAKKCYLLLDVYHLIFERDVNYCLVYVALVELLKQRDFFSDFSHVLTDPLTLMVTSAMEYAMQVESGSSLVANS